MMKKGVLIVGHGSRSEDAVTVFRQVVEEVRRRGVYTVVEGAHMELAEPGIADAVKILKGLNVKEVIVLPYFLYEGIHLKKDIPELIGILSAEYPDMNFRIAKPIGFEPVLADILLKRAGEVDF